jgi:AcrR family transcriptional regulator
LSGAKITMAQVAASAGVAKATLYNHFRTREEVLTALLTDEVDALVHRLAERDLATALRWAAVAISNHPLLDALGDDPAVLANLSRVDVRSSGWVRVAEATERLLARAGRRGTPSVLRWLGSFVLAPADEQDIAADVAVLVAGLPPREPCASSGSARLSTGAAARS